MKSFVSDQELVNDFAKNPNSAMNQIISRYYSRVKTYIRSYVKSQVIAEDLCQDTFLKIYISLKNNNYQDDGRFACWLMRIAHNMVIDYFRRQSKMFTSSHDENDISLYNDFRLYEDTNETIIMRQQLSHDLKSLIEQLPEDQKTTVLMRINFDMTFKEIADYQGISINTALGRMRYAIINLRKMMNENHLSLAV